MSQWKCHVHLSGKIKNPLTDETSFWKCGLFQAFRLWGRRKEMRAGKNSNWSWWGGEWERIFYPSLPRYFSRSQISRRTLQSERLEQPDHWMEQTVIYQTVNMSTHTARALLMSLMPSPAPDGTSSIWNILHSSKLRKKTLLNPLRNAFPEFLDCWNKLTPNPLIRNTNRNHLPKKR